MGKNQWQEAEQWPPKGTKMKAFYLGSQGKANTLKGDGVLGRRPPKQDQPDTFVYDPLNPVNSYGGNVCCTGNAVKGGSFDQSEMELRDDILVYTSDVLEKDTEVSGFIESVLYVSSDAKDTDFTIKLIDVHPEGSATFTANADAYLERLAELARYTTDALSSVPAESRILLTSHDAFNYFGNAYGFEVVGIQGISTESEAGLQRIAELVQMLIDRDIGAVFVETSVSDRNIRALVEGARAEGHSVVIGGELFSDAMGEPGTYEGTYVGMIDSNATTIARALGGDAPNAGMQGLLN